nr:unnamed protein product [Digitaria exilis]
MDTTCRRVVHGVPHAGECRSQNAHVTAGRPRRLLAVGLVRLGDPFLDRRVSFAFPPAASRAAARKQLPFSVGRWAGDVGCRSGEGVGRTPSPSQARFDLGRVSGTRPFSTCVRFDGRDPSRGGRGSGETDVPDPFHPLVVWRGPGSDETEAFDQSRLALPGSSSVRAPFVDALTVGPLIHEPHSSPRPCRGVKDSGVGFRGEALLSFYFLANSWQLPKFWGRDQGNASTAMPCAQHVTEVTTFFAKRQPVSFSVGPGSRQLAGIQLGPRITAAYPPIECDATRRLGSGLDLTACGHGGQLMAYSAASCHARTSGLRALGRAPPRCGRLPPRRPYIYGDAGVTGYPFCIPSQFPSPCSRSPFVAFVDLIFNLASSKSTVEMASKGSSSSAQLRPWARSTATVAALESLVSRGLLCPRTAQEEWISPHPSHKTPSPPAGYVVSFMAYHVRGFAVPAHQFVREVLYHFGVELHALAPNGVQQMANFVALCEGYLGIDPDFNLFLLFFKAVLVRPHGALAPWGYCSLQAKQSRVDKFPRSELRGSNKDWNKGWFYLKSHAKATLPPFDPASSPPAKEPAHWQYGPEASDRKKLAPHLDCLAKLRSCGLTGIGIAEAFHRRRVAPLMARPLRLFEMLPTTSEAELLASLVSRVVPSEDEVRARLALLVDSQRAASMVVPTPGQPPMLPGPGAAPGGLRASRGALSEEQPSLDEARRRNHEAWEAARKRKREKTKKRLNREERRRERERKEHRGDEVGSDLASSCDEKENPGGSSPLLGDCTVVDLMAHGEQRFPPHLRVPHRWGRPVRVRPPPPNRCGWRFTTPKRRAAPVKRLRRDAPPAVVPDSLEPRAAADPCPTRAEGSAPPPALGGSSPPRWSPLPGVTYVLASSPVAGEVTGSAEQAMDIDASAGAVAGGELGASAMASVAEPLPTAAAPIEGAVVDAPAEAPTAPLVVPTAFEPLSMNPREGVEVSRWSAEARSDAYAGVGLGAATHYRASGSLGVDGDHGPAVDPKHILQIDAWLESLQQMAAFPATLLQMALTLRTVAIPSSRSMLLALSRTRSIEQEAINQARRAWDVANSSRDTEASSARRISELERELATQASAHQKELAALRVELGSIRTDATDVRSGFQAQIDTLREERAAAVRACVDTQTEHNQAVAAKEDAEGACAQLSQLVADLRSKAQTSTGRAETLEAALSTARNSLEEKDSKLEGMFSLTFSCPASLIVCLPSRMADGITHGNTLVSRFGMLRDTAGADIERLPGDLHRLRVVAISMLDALEVPLSSDPARLPAELDLVRACVGALAKHSLVRGVQEAFTLVRSHYDGIRFDRLAAGFPNEFTSEALDAMAEELRAPVEQFANGVAPATDTEGNPVDGTDPDQSL